jgi:RimJ/RimL family protein N-acetyltransferase
MSLSISLSNSHVSLEPLEARHREPLRAAAADPDLWRFSLVNMHGGTHGGTFDTWFDQRMAGNEAGVEATWAVWDTASGAYAGSSSYLAIALSHRKLEVGATWYAKPYWAGAVNPSCKRLLFAYGFEALGLNRIELKLDATNIRSFRAVSRLGARFEGIHRAHMLMPDGRIRDTAWFSVLKEEWPTVRDSLDARLAAFAAPT